MIQCLMSWMFFIDESGHDHRTTPYEVWGGAAIHDAQLWPFVQGMQRLEQECFGVTLSDYKKELKGCKLVSPKCRQFASQNAPLEDEERRLHCRRFLERGLNNLSPERIQFSAYGQACFKMALGTMELLNNHQAKVFAAATPPISGVSGELLRKDHVYLFERFYYLLEQHRERGLIVMDQVEKTEERKFVARLERYFTRTETGRRRTQWIVPVPFFVDSAMAYPVQAADLCIYCVNWGFRIRGMDAPVRDDVAENFGALLRTLQFQGDGERDGEVFPTYGIFYVATPYSAR